MQWFLHCEFFLLGYNKTNNMAESGNSTSFFSSVALVCLFTIACLVGINVLSEVQGEKKCASETEAMKGKYQAGLYTFLIGFIVILLFVATFTVDYYGLKYPKYHSAPATK